MPPGGRTGLRGSASVAGQRFRRRISWATRIIHLSRKPRAVMSGPPRDSTARDRRPHHGASRVIVPAGHDLHKPGPAAIVARQVEQFLNSRVADKRLAAAALI